jgi:hypothetical protein
MVQARRRLPMTGEIDGHRLVPRHQWAHLATPVASVARPPVDEHQARRPRAVHLERQGNAIPGCGDAAHRLAAICDHGLQAWAEGVAIASTTSPAATVPESPLS